MSRAPDRRLSSDAADSSEGASDRIYADPRLVALYDLENPWGRDNEFYFGLVTEPRARILDLGCGTGTLACRYAQAGHAVTAVDPAAAMLAAARAKPGASRVEWIQARAESFRGEKVFDWIVLTGHAFQVFLTDAALDGLMTTVKTHLRDGGAFAFETRNPAIDWVAAWSARPSRTLTVEGKEVVSSLENVSRNGEIVRFDHHYRFEDVAVMSSSNLRFIPLDRIDSVLAAAGLRRTELFGDWDRSPFDPDRSREMIVIAR